MICRECGAKIEDGSLECKFCGAMYGNEESEQLTEPQPIPVVEETYGVSDDAGDIEELFDENEAKRQLQIEKIREEKQAQLEEIEKRRKIKKRKQRRNRVLVVLLVLLFGAAVAAGVYYTGQNLNSDDSEHAVIVTPKPVETEEPDPTYSPVKTPEATVEPEITPEPTIEPEPTPEPTLEPEATVEPTVTPEPVTTQKPVATPKPTATLKPVATPKPLKKTYLTSARITGGEVIKANGKTYMSFIYNNKWYYAKVSDNTTTKFIAWKQMTVNGYNAGETYKGVPVYTLTKVIHHNNPQSTNSQPATSGQVNGYVFPNSSTQLLSAADVQGKTAYQLRIARNEIYARHGRKFNDASLQSYFNSCSWYKVNDSYNYSNENANLNEIEKANIKTIKSYEK